jgi:hypothetical protein
MDKLLDIFSTRELSSLIWLSIALFAMLFNKGFREGLVNILKLLLGKKIGSFLLLMTAYSAIFVFSFYKIRLWDESLLKDTIFWYLTAAMLLFFNIHKANENSHFKDIVKGNLKWALLLEFFINFYTFSLPVEIVFVPLMVIIGLLQGVAQTDKKYIQVDKFLKNILSIIGWFVFIFVLYKTVKSYDDFFTLHNFFAFLLPPILTLALIPFLYFIALFMNYETLFVHLDIFSNDIDKKQKLKKEILFAANLNLNKINTIRQKIKKADWYHKDDTRPTFEI